MPLPALPPELWVFVVDNLWRADLCTCLSVSRMLRVPVLARLFRTVHIHFGARGTDDAIQNAWEDDIREQWLENEAAQVRRAGELLDAITQGGVFARAVKKVVVHAAHARHECVMERMMLVKALTALPHLLEFAWIGRSPYLQQDVVDALAKSCRNLKRLHIDEGAEAFSLHCRLPGVTFTGLTNLSEVCCFADDLTQESPSPGSIADDCFEALVAANADSLRVLETEMMWIDNVPVRIYGCLTHLEVERVADNVPLPLLLRHAPQLESLVLRNTNFDDVLEVLTDARGRLPHLRSLALSPVDDDEEFTDEHAEVFIAFFKETPHLRRLNLLVHYQGIAESSVDRLLEEIGAHCRQLEAFGFSFGPDSMIYEEIFECLTHALPRSLTAVSLSLPWDPSTLDSTAVTPLLDKLAGLPDLRFLHIGWGGERSFHLSAEELAQDMASLKLLILGDGTPSAWDIDRPLELGGEITLDRWKRKRLEYRDVEDFMPGTEDGEWLVRHTIGQHFEAVPF